MKRRNFTELTFKEIVDSILKESAEEIDEFAAETEDIDADESMEDDEFDVEDFEEEGTEETEGDVTLTLTLEEVSVLRSVMAKIDAASGETEEETDEVEETEDEDDVEISEEGDDEEVADIPVPEEEETVIGAGQGDKVVTLSNKGVSRKKGAPAIDRSRNKKEGLMGSPKAAGDADVVELGNVGVSRKKETPAVSRTHKVAGTRIAPGKATIEIGK